MGQEQQTAATVEVSAAGLDWDWHPDQHVVWSADHEIHIAMPTEVEPDLAAVRAFLAGWAQGYRLGQKEGAHTGAEEAREAIRKALGVMSGQSTHRRLAALEDA